MKKLNFIFLMCIPFLFQSCQGQNLDLEKLSLPIKGDDLKTLKLSNSGAGIGTQEVQYTSYVPDAEKSISFGGVVAPKSASSSESLVRFFSKNEGSTFQGYTLNLFSPDAFEKTLAYLLKNKTQFKLVFDDGKDTEERARVFISNSNGTTYLLLSRLNGEGKKTGYLDGVGKGEEALLSARIGGSFGYYEAFLEYKKHKSGNLSYLDFLRETNNELYKQSNNLKQ
jgi:hypothetical protein